MKLSNSLSAFIGLVSILYSQPTIANSACDPISKYSTEWFLANTKPDYTGSFDSTALFYSSGLSERAKRFASQARKITIWEVWPCENYIIKELRSSPLKCIMEKAEDQMTYFENMSQAFAMKAHNIATVLHSNIDNPPTDGIWGRKELPVLQAVGNPGGIVDYITAIEMDTSRWKMVWDRFDSGRLLEETQAIYQTIYQRVIAPRDLGDSDGDIEKRGDSDACPMLRLDESHPLY